MRGRKGGSVAAGALVDLSELGRGWVGVVKRKGRIEMIVSTL